MTQVLKISKPNKDVLTVTDKRDLIFDMNNNVFKIAFTGSLSVVVTYIDDGFGGTIGSAENSFSHNLGYVPVGFAFITDFGLQLPYFTNSGAGVSATFSYRLTSSKIYISVYDTGVFGFTPDVVTFNFKYQIMADKII